ncbi:MAG: hypothetical protein K2X01_11430 [Cyanobacteria bacterium]|nr:hypothetical protein [Cyanobacteriota bacterium]
MSRKKKSKEKEAPAPPPPPPPANSYNYEGGVLRSSSVFDPAQNAYVNSVFQDPAEVAAKQKLLEQQNSILARIGKTTPERAQQLNEHEQAFYQRAVRPLDEEYTRGKNQAREDFNASGFMNSTGYEDYRTNNLDRIYQQGLKQSAEDAKLAREQLAAQDDANLLAQYNSISGGLDANIANNLRVGDFARVGSANLNQYLSDSYRNQLENSRLQRSYSQQERSSPPFWRRLLFGF